MGPYLGLGFLLILIAVAIASQKAPPIVEEFPDAEGRTTAARASCSGVLWRNKRYRYGVVAQFFNVAAQVCVWTYLIQYVGSRRSAAASRRAASTCRSACWSSSSRASS